MRHIRELAENILSGSEQAAARRAERIATEVTAGETLRAFAGRQYGPAFGELLPEGLTLGEFLSGSTDVSVEAASERLKLCAVCSGKPARCASREDQLLPIGLRPLWRDGGLEAERCGLYAEHLLRWKLEKSGVPVAMLDATLESYAPSTEWQARALVFCRRYVDEFLSHERHKRGLQISGSGTGVGKTHLAIGVMRALVHAGVVRRPMFLFVPDFLDRIRQSFDDKERSGAARRMLERVRQADLLVLDDLGAQRTTEWVQEQLIIILNARWSNGYATIITTNAMLEELRASLGERAQSRLKGSMAERVLVDGEDRRR